MIACSSVVSPVPRLVSAVARSYMNSLMQQLYMVPEFRHGILAQLSTDAMTDESQRADSLMYQMQAIFGHLMDSDEHAYDADGFCAAYKVGETQRTRESAHPHPSSSVLAVAF